MLKHFNAGIAYAMFKTRQRAFYVAGMTAFLMSAYFVVGYMVGNLQFWAWNQEQWASALPGLGITFAMTAFQGIMYSSSHHHPAKWTRLLAVGVAVGFAFLTEIGQGMERDNLRMETKSLESPTLQAILKNLEASHTAGQAYSNDLQDAQARLNGCLEKLHNRQIDHCVHSQGRLDAVKQAIVMANEARTTRSLALANTAKTMERDENNYHPLVNLMRQSFGVSGIVASFSVSLLIICCFEYAFHYLSKRYAEARDYLLEHGYDTTRTIRQPPRHLSGKPSTLSPSLHIRVGNESSAKPSTYEAVSAAKVGAVVDCPECGAEFMKANKWHTFCKLACKDAWHNAQKPARQAFVNSRKGERGKSKKT